MTSAADVWEKVKGLMETSMTAVSIDTWFGDCEAVALEETRLVLCVPTEFKRNVIRTRFQPIVENAILHGVDGVEDGAVRVEVSQTRDGLLRVAVSDNGKGFPPEMLGRFREISRPGGHLGLYNVDTILLKYYGEGCGLTLENGEGGAGAAVTAVLPVRREEGAEC